MRNSMIPQRSFKCILATIKNYCDYQMNEKSNNNTNDYIFTQMSEHNIQVDPYLYLLRVMFAIIVHISK